MKKGSNDEQDDEKGYNWKLHTSIYVNNTDTDNIESYIYLGQRITTRDKTQYEEIQIKITTGWTALAKHRDIFKGNIGTCFQKQVYKSCGLPAIMYGAETWELTTQAKNKLAAAQTNMERRMLNITYSER